MDDVHSAPWWGVVQVDTNQVSSWRIGPLRLWIQRQRSEWRVGRSTADDRPHTAAELNRPVSVSEIDPAARFERFGLRGNSNHIRLAPRLADRPVVSRPEEPFRLPAGEEVVLFVSTPLWLGVSTETPPHLLVDTPISRPSDTWFGPPTHDGELCYATTTVCRLHIEDVPVRPHRCVTAVTIRNGADEALAIDRLKLPVNTLTPFVSGDGQLWTEDVLLERHEVGELARLSVGKAPPAFAVRPEPAAAPRTSAPGNMITRAFSSLFS